MGTVTTVNFIIGAILTLLLCYQGLYLFVPILKKEKKRVNPQLRRYAFLIAARNEQDVIGQLVQSIKKQDYPAELISVFVVADNCSDNTALVARDAGAVVFERFDDNKIGKGYALNYLLESIDLLDIQEQFDGYFIFDADNLLDKNYVREMNNVFSKRYQIVTSYRNAKNFDDNWLSAGYGIWFLRESVYLNYARRLLGVSCAVSGTGYLFSKEVLESCGGWNFFLLTEDIEFTAKNIIEGRRVGYCHDAIFYDEHPTSFKQSWTQRERWAKGYLQVLGKYGKGMLIGALKGSFSCYDIGMAFAPAIIFTLIGIVFNLVALVVGLITGVGALVPLTSLGMTLVSTYLLMFVMGAVTTVTEWRRIHSKAIWKILYMFSFPVFVLSYFPIAFTAFFKKVKWTPVKHSKAITIDDLTEDGEVKKA